MATELTIEAGLTHLDAAALIWARATAARDGDPDIAPLELARPVLASVFAASPEAVLLTARDGAGPPLGFAVLAPVTEAGGRGLEVTHLGVDPSAWDRGVAAALLSEIRRRVSRSGSREGWLWVYADNERAVRAYTSAGWRATGTERLHPRSRRIERRFRLEPEGADGVRRPG